MNILTILAPAVLVFTSGSLADSTIFDQIFMTDFQKTVTESKTLEVDLSTIDFSTGAFSSEVLKMGTPQDLFLANFEDWAKQHDITLIGTNKNAKHLTRWGFIPEKDGVELKDVPGVLIAAQLLYKIPDDVLEVMKNKTIYFSTENGRSKSIHAAWGPDSLNRGFIIEQSHMTANVIHELGHIVDVHGIQGAYDDKQNVFIHAKEKRDEIFQVKVAYEPSSPGAPQGHITRYSSESDSENFAEHFAYYVVFPDEFRNRIQTDPLLIDEYEFLRDYIFDGTEF
jgi:hypothetical protein